MKTEVSLSLEAPGEGEGERKKLSTESTNVWYKKNPQNNQNEIYYCSDFIIFFYNSLEFSVCRRFKHCRPVSKTNPNPFATAEINQQLPT